MVSQEEFQRVRNLLVEALEEAYAGYKIPPVELAPGYWTMWPTRDVNLRLEETRYWNYGVPAGGTGKLQAHIIWSYGHHERIKPEKPFTAKDARKAAKSAAHVSQILVLRGNQNASMPHIAAGEDAYLIGYQAVEEASDEDRLHLWKIREQTYRLIQNAPWKELHETVHGFLKMDFGVRGVLDWDPEENRVWDPLAKELGDDRVYDMAFRGTVNALDDWAVARGLLDAQWRLKD